MQSRLLLEIGDRSRREVQWLGSAAVWYQSLYEWLPRIYPSLCNAKLLGNVLLTSNYSRNAV